YLFKILLWKESAGTCRFCAHWNKQNAWIGCNTEGCSQLPVFLSINFVNLNLPLVLFLQFRENCRQSFTWSAPHCIEIHYYRDIALKLPGSCILVIKDMLNKTGLIKFYYSIMCKCCFAFLLSLRTASQQADCCTQEKQSSKKYPFHYISIYSDKLIFLTEAHAFCSLSCYPLQLINLKFKHYLNICNTFRLTAIIAPVSANRQIVVFLPVHDHTIIAYAPGHQDNNMEQLREMLLQHLQHPVFKVITDTAEAEGLETYVIGGYVRDIFLKRPNTD